MIISMTVAALIALSGAALMIRLVYLVYKYLYRLYNDWIIA